jgi:predicted hotdog family 3-hydroxylacyl-ACP dehydratase
MSTALVNYSLHELIPHREPMLLLSSVCELGDNFSTAEIIISESSSFFAPGKGVPSWIGIEYMGQTAALIAGYQLQQGTVTPHLGLLLGTRKYEAFAAWFKEGDVLLVSCKEIAVVGQELATFQCDIRNKNNGVLYATAKLSVFRKPLPVNP